ncbi:hypothetical protein FDB23_16160 [Clostridium botulinum]|nr:hypothetical protein [Clostridium botulinum]
MTELGKSLIEEGIEKGKSEGKQENAIETAKRAIKKGMSNDVISELTELSIAEIEEIRMAMEL